MNKFISERAKLLCSRTCLLFLFLFAAYLYYANLSGAMLSFPDENRALHHTHYSPFLYLVIAPFTHFFQRYDMPFYVNATFGLANLILLYRLIRHFFERQTAAWTTVFYLFYDYTLSYVKLLYYSTMVTTFVLLTLICFVTAEKKHKPIGYVAAGIFSAMMFATNASTYGIVVGLVVFLIVMKLQRLVPESRIRLFHSLFLYTLAFAVAVWGIDCYVAWRHPGDGFLENLVKYRSDAAAIMNPNEMGWPALSWRITHLFQSTVKSASQIIRNSWLLIITLAVTLYSLRRKDKVFMTFFSFALAGSGVLIASCVLRIHPTAFRHYVWISIFISLCMGLAAARHHRLGPGFRYTFRIIMAVYLVLAALKCVRITHAMQSFGTINQYLAENHISKPKLATFVPINRYEDFLNKNTTATLPIVRTYREVDEKRRIYYLISWPHVMIAFKRGLITHCLLSGYGPMITLGMDDPLLEGVSPLKSWPHPAGDPDMHILPWVRTSEGEFAHVPKKYAPENRITFDLYALSDIEEQITKNKLERYIRTRINP